ncbi:MAG TPA: hypothetical protein VFQ12_10920 [Thermoleophilaceae bacterium]|nr:hypothetical protein [Thermoleophilaceae bacterium]
MRRGAATVALLAATLGVAAPAVAAPRGCDPLDPSACLLPWPNDHFRKGGKLALKNSMMPRSKDGSPIQARDYNWSDGFSPGQIIVTLVPGLDLRRTGAAPVTDIGRSLKRKQSIVVIDAKTGKRQLIWSELNSLAKKPRQRTLNIHPGIGWREGHRYIVALRNLRRSNGRVIRARRAFRVYRDGLPAGSRAVERRRPHMESIFRKLAKAGIKRGSLYLAWDFMVASERGLTKRLLSIRNRAFAGLGDTNLRDLTVAGTAPSFTVEQATDISVGRRVSGHFTVPCFLDEPGCPPGSRFRLDKRGLPVRAAGNTYQAPFVCIVPDSSATTPARPLLFGHGLFQDESAVDAIALLAPVANSVMCATKFSGMSLEDVANAGNVSGDLSRFPTMADRLQQGILNQLFLGRLMVHPQGLESHAEFAGHIDNARLFYAGASLGGIIGGALTAVAPDFDRSALIVPGFRFSLLLTRSTQFPAFGEVLYEQYPDPVEQSLINSFIQLLWDRGEANAYAWHLTRDPLPNTPRHTVLLHEAFGDHQVTNVATETEARLIGARLRTPALDPGRSRDRRPFYGIKPIRSYPFRGNALVVFDIGPLRPEGCAADGPPDCLGTPPAPVTNTPPDIGVDPHALTPLDLAAVRHFIEFLRIDGAFINTCGDHPCYAQGWTGP